MRTVTEQGAVAALRRYAKASGGQNEGARNLGISKSYMSDLIHGRRAFSDRILERLGLRRETRLVKR